MSEKMSKQVEAQISELNAKLDAANRQIQDLQSQKNRAAQDNADLTRQLEEAEHRVGALTKDKNALTTALEEAKRALEDETRVSSMFLQEQPQWQQCCVDLVRDSFNFILSLGRVILTLNR